MNLATFAVVVGVLMPQPWGNLVRRDHVLVAGMPGCGKTPFAASLAAAAARVAYCDPTDEWSELGEVVLCEYIADAAEKRGGDWVVYANAANELARELLTGTVLRVVFVPRAGHYAEDFRRVVAVCRAASSFSTGLVLLGDEVGDLAAGGASDVLLELHRNGHKDGVATILASPCMTDFPKRCRDTASRVFSFFQKNAADRAALAAEYGDDFATQAAAWRYPNPPAAWRNPTLHE